MSFKSLVRSTVLLGSTTAATTLVSILRVKALALMVGPAGLGLLGVLAGIASAGTTIAALGSDTSGTRQIALSREDAAAFARVRRMLALVAALHGLVSVIAIWFLRHNLAAWMLGNAAYADEIGLVGIAVALSLVAGLQIAQLQGLGRVTDIARINLQASALGTVLGLSAVWSLGLGGIVLLVLAQPAIAAVLALRRTASLSPAKAPALSARMLIVDWARAIAHGVPYMLSFLMLALVPLAIRALVIRELGIEAAGHFHAAWTMSVIYVGFLLNAMSADYFPRLTALVGNQPAATQLINDQVRLGLAIGGVAMIVILAGAPVLVPLLYSRAFSPTVEIVELQAFGNLMKIAGWPIAFLAMARGRAMQFFLVELAWSLLLLLLVWLGLPHLGLAATGAAFAVACLFFLTLQVTLAYLTFGFVLERGAMLMLLVFAMAGVITLIAARHSALLQAMTGGLLAVILGLASLRFILARIDDDGRIAAVVRKAFATLGWPMPGPAPIEQG
ncbi:MAG: hypothetical protein R3D44_13585 [Hyphomicrobiaceae bacterium]